MAEMPSSIFQTRPINAVSVIPKSTLNIQMLQIRDDGKNIYGHSSISHRQTSQPTNTTYIARHMLFPPSPRLTAA